MAVSNATRIGTDTVELKLGERVYELVPTLEAMRVVSRVQGGFAKAAANIQSLDIDTIESVISSGLQKGEVKNLDRKLAEEGWMNVALIALEFVTLLRNAGKKTQTEEDDDGEGEGGRPLESQNSY